MFIFHYIKKDGLNTIPCNQVCHLIAALGLCEIFKQETCHKPEWCELEPYDPAHIIGPQGVVPWTDSYTGKPYTGYIFRNKNQNHINQSEIIQIGLTAVKFILEHILNFFQTFSAKFILL